MDTWKKNDLLYRIHGKLRNFLRPIYYNGSSVTLKEIEAAKAIQAVMLKLKNTKPQSTKEDIILS